MFPGVWSVYPPSQVRRIGDGENCAKSDPRDGASMGLIRKIHAYSSSRLFCVCGNIMNLIEIKHQVGGKELKNQIAFNYLIQVISSDG